MRYDSGTDEWIEAEGTPTEPGEYYLRLRGIGDYCGDTGFSFTIIAG